MWGSDQAASVEVGRPRAPRARTSATSRRSLGDGVKRVYESELDVAHEARVAVRADDPRRTPGPDATSTPRTAQPGAARAASLIVVPHAAAAVSSCLERLLPVPSRDSGSFASGFCHRSSSGTRSCRATSLGLVIKPTHLPAIDSATGLSRLGTSSRDWPVAPQLALLLRHARLLHLLAFIARSTAAGGRGGCTRRITRARTSTGCPASRSHALEILDKPDDRVRPDRAARRRSDGGADEGRVDAAWGMYIHSNSTFHQTRVGVPGLLFADLALAA